MRFEHARQQMIREGRHQRLLRATCTFAGAMVIACAGAVIVFAVPADVLWVDTLTWQTDGQRPSGERTT